MRSMVLIVFILIANIGVTYSAEPIIELIGVQKIWDQAAHNAFTDLLFHDGNWYCVFREASSHVSNDGTLRVITSKDGEHWESAARISMENADLRDAKINIAPDGRLCLSGAAAWHDKTKGSHQSYLWYSKNARDWSTPVAIGEPDFWIWRIIWHKQVGYGIGYSTGKTHGTRLYKTVDGSKFEILVADLNHEGYTNESALHFEEDGTFYCLIRRDGNTNNTALLGSAQAPYSSWSFKDTKVRIGGPQFLSMPHGELFVGGRTYVGGAKAALWTANVETGQLTELLTLPSSGDCSYPGMIFRDGIIWMSYYSSHEGKTNIYLAKIRKK